MPRPAFNRAMQQLANARFADTRIRIAQQIIRSNPVTAQQVYEVMTVMHFESSRLRIARFAYRHVVNPNEYYVVNDAFRFESSIRKLDRHLASCTF
jgi:hypothetical protein